MADAPVLNRYIVKRLLEKPDPDPAPSVPSAEARRSWQVDKYQTIDYPLMRLWDGSCGSQLDKENDGRMFARSDRMRLDTDEMRKHVLKAHFMKDRWTLTPFISFTSDWQEIQKLAMERKEQRPKRWGSQKLTVIHPAVRLQKGLPILELEKEMAAYGIENPNGEQSKYTSNHFVCLWEVTPDEIICQWSWKEIEERPSWFQSHLMRKFGNIHSSWLGGYPYPITPEHKYEQEGVTKLIDDLAKHALTVPSGCTRGQCQATRAVAGPSQHNLAKANATEAANDPVDDEKDEDNDKAIDNDSDQQPQPYCRDITGSEGGYTSSESENKSVILARENAKEENDVKGWLSRTR